MSTGTLVADAAGGRAAPEPRTAFVLAGGAALGAMQAGMIHALYELGIAPDLLIGTSVRALNAAFLASRPATVATAEELAAIWRGLRRADVLPLRPGTLIGGVAGRRDHLITDRALRRIYVLPTQNPGDGGLPRPPQGALAAGAGTTPAPPAVRHAGPDRGNGPH